MRWCQDSVSRPPEGDRGIAIATGASPSRRRGDGDEQGCRLGRIDIRGIIIDDRKGEKRRARATLLRVWEGYITGPRNRPSAGRDRQRGTAHQWMPAGVADQDTKWTTVCDAAIGHGEPTGISSGIGTWSDPNALLRG